MKKLQEFPDVFDVLHVEYESRCKSLAYAPTHAVETGDKVITSCGTGTVMAGVSYVTAEDGWFKVVSGIYPVDKITNKIVEVK